MTPFDPTANESEATITRAAEVADSLADAVGKSPAEAKRRAECFTDDDLTLGLAFLARVIEIASMSSRVLADTQRARQVAIARVIERPR